ncbi:MAG: DUF2520 domain-containing protein [Muribaculum sp.]|nr:DUF2520 domain-containing protein [Muribaculum sp.]
MIDNIAIIGRGNVAVHLAKAFQSVGKAVASVNPYTLENLPDKADLYLICVSDNAVESVAERLAPHVDEHAIIAHTAGSIPLEILSKYSGPKGVLYPLQTFSKSRNLDYSTIPFFIEGSDDDTETDLISLSSAVSARVETADNFRRKLIHLSAVFACNFANRMMDIADEILQRDGLDISILLPLIKETLKKIEFMNPHDAQTGPAVRRDSKVIHSHLQQLLSFGMISEAKLYNLISESIIESHT